MLSGYGSLCEVYEAGPVESNRYTYFRPGNPPPLSVKARALHRVKLLNKEHVHQPMNHFIRYLGSTIFMSLLPTTHEKAEN